MSLNGLLDTFKENSTWAFLNPILNVLQQILWPILIVVAAVGTIYAVYLGVMMAKAENAEKREEAKKRIINAVIALVVTVVLILLLQLFVQYGPKLLGDAADTGDLVTPPETPPANTDDKENAVIGLLKMLF